MTNTGTTTLNGVSVADSVTNAAEDNTPLTVTCPGGSIAPGASVICSALYTVAQADVDNTGSNCAPDNNPPVCFGQVSDSATASATNPAGAPVGPSAASGVTVVGIFAVASVYLNVTSSSTNFTGPSQTVPFQYQVTNTGTISLDTFNLSDEVDGNPLTISSSCNLNSPTGPAFDPSSDVLGPGASSTAAPTT